MQMTAETLRVIVVGAIAGWLVAVFIYTHLVRGGPVDIRIFGGVPVLLLLIAAIACWVPARRAAGIDPMIALRHE